MPVEVQFQSTLNPVLGSIVVSIPACHAGDRGSIPRRGEFFFLLTVVTDSLCFRLNSYLKIY